MILIDNDGVNAASHLALVAYCRQKYGIDDLHYQDITAWNFGKFRKKLGLTVPQILDDFYDLWQHHSKTIAVMDDQTVNVMNYILKTYDAEMVTDNNLAWVKPWLEQKGINTGYLKAHRGDKSQLPYSVFIEDNPTLVLPKKTIWLLRDHPFNQEVKPTHRWFSSTELPDLLQQYEQSGLVRRR